MTNLRSMVERLCTDLEAYAEQDEGNGHHKAAAGARKLIAEARAALAVEPAADPKPCEHLRSELLAEKTRDGDPLFQMRKCLDCTLIFRVRSSLNRRGEL